MAWSAQDDLVKPLGQSRAKQQRRLPVVPITPVLWTGLAALCLGLTGYIALVDDPLGGLPHAIAPVQVRKIATGPNEPVSPSFGGPEQVANAASVVQPPRRGSSTASQMEQDAGVSVVRGSGDAAAPGAIIINLEAPVTIKLNPSPDKRLTDRTRYGLLPKIGADGTKPMDVYARPSGSLPGGAAPKGRVALVVTGLGISQSATMDAIAKLPGPVTMAFAPYGGELERHVSRAREDGHEVMLQAPMEPFDYPDNDPGPHTLTVTPDAGANIDKLHWVMGRFTGYVGVMNFMGAKLTSDPAALLPILREINQRGLFVLDDGSSARSLMQQTAQDMKLPALKADSVIDVVSDAALIDKELNRLETIATEKGVAIGAAAALPLTVRQIERWVETLEAKGILLVPVSTLAPRTGAAKMTRSP